MNHHPYEDPYEELARQIRATPREDASSHAEDTLENAFGLDDLPPVDETDVAGSGDRTWEIAARRESFAERQAGRWFVVALVSVLTVVGIGVWDHLHPREKVDAFVVVIREKDDGQVIVIEPMQRLRDFVVSAETIQHVLPQFVVALRRLGLDRVDMKDREQFVQAHVCGPAAKASLLPLQRQAGQVAVNIDTLPFTTESPMTWRVSWMEAWSDAQGNPLGDYRFYGDFTLKRFTIDYTQKDDLAVHVRNPIGLCVSSYQVHQVRS